GGDENRLRFLREVIGSVRSAVGWEIAVGLRISADEMGHDGLRPDEVAAACMALDAQGGLDYLNVTAGSSATLQGSVHIVPPMAVAHSYTTPLSASVRKLVSIPVLVGGRINQPQEAERALAEGFADACGMTRALICDPELPRKAREGRLDEIRACVACNQACIGHFHLGYPISCIQHPETGRERRYGRRVPAAGPKRVLVVGAGPAGMKAAAVAAERGHRVHLAEAAGRPGGQVLLAQQLPGRDEFGGAADNLYREVTRAEVKVSFHCRVDAAFVAAEGADAVVVATGARPYRPPLEVLGEPWVADAWEVLAHPDASPRGRLVVVDWRGDWVGVGVARLLAAAGRKVTLAVRGYHAADRLQQYVRDAQLAALHQAGVAVEPLVRPYGADDDTVYLQHVLTDEPVLVEGVAGVVLACGHEPETALLDELHAAGVPAAGIGDCLAPRSVEEAVLEGLVTASEL
ncbi:MAG TPA: FAD-dependent oxidoreductase, partial [Acidimicrobiales bacterium]|nr:FAD-dependent oxidoreductase [Acidimicrobiales bacterium]